jgi:hypothetical protein
MADVIDQVDLPSLFQLEDAPMMKDNEETTKERHEVSDDGDVEAREDATANTDSEAESETTEIHTHREDMVKSNDAAPAKQFKKGQYVLYRNYTTGVEEEMVVVGVHYDDFPNIYYTVQQLKAGEDGTLKERQTDASRLTLIEKPPEVPSQPSVSPVNQEARKDDSESDKSSDDSASRKRRVPPSSTGEARKVPIKFASQPPKESVLPQAPAQPSRVPQPQNTAEAHRVAQPEQAAQPPQPPSQPSRQTRRQPQPRRRAQAAEIHRVEDETTMPFNIVVSLGGRALAVPVVADTTVRELLAHMSRFIGLPASLLRLVYRNMYINNVNLTMDDLGISEGSRVMIATRASRGWY